ncbi:hypothetical protein NLJ89_g504 [Agrocybe chaxingu]|uniref:Uncharacterized protein n=1 Tax=Agrocybe chaxingu TaxID=84603 RepID=A0A9W8N1T7_9AGAR|nr:hypothetical protein NLJ89_g504 [Agrocybe chaxingu]
MDAPPSYYSVVSADSGRSGADASTYATLVRSLSGRLGLEVIQTLKESIDGALLTYGGPNSDDPIESTGGQLSAPVVAANSTSFVDRMFATLSAALGDPQIEAELGLSERFRAVQEEYQHLLLSSKESGASVSDCALRSQTDFAQDPNLNKDRKFELESFIQEASQLSENNHALIESLKVLKSNLDEIATTVRHEAKEVTASYKWKREESRAKIKVLDKKLAKLQDRPQITVDFAKMFGGAPAAHEAAIKKATKGGKDSTLQALQYSSRPERNDLCDEEDKRLRLLSAHADRISHLEELSSHLRDVVTTVFIHNLATILWVWKDTLHRASLLRDCCGTTVHRNLPAAPFEQTLSDALQRFLDGEPA